MNSRSFSSTLVPILLLNAPHLTHLHLVSNWNNFFLLQKCVSLTFPISENGTAIVHAYLCLTVSKSSGILLSISCNHPLFFTLTSVSQIQTAIVFASCLPLWPSLAPQFLLHSPYLSGTDLLKTYIFWCLTCIQSLCSSPMIFKMNPLPNSQVYSSAAPLEPTPSYFHVHNDSTNFSLCKFRNLLFP